jgi:hypothetical protein
VNGVIRRLGGMLLPSSDVGRTLAIGAGIDSLGTGMFVASFAPATTLAGAVALLAPVPLGRLADRLGTGSFYVALLLLRGIGYGCFAFVSDFTGFLVLTVLLSRRPVELTDPAGRCDGVIGGQDRTRTMASIRAVRNVGLTVGFLLVGAAFAATEPFVFTAIFVGNGFSFVVVAVMVRHVLSKAGSIVERATSASTATAAERVRSPFRDSWFMVFTVGNGVLSLYDSVLIVLLPIWVIEHTAVPVALVPVLRSTRC